MLDNNTPSPSSWSESLIDFAFRVYAEPDVEELCLYLQNEYHANVNIVLWACWLESEKLIVSSSWLDEVLISIDTLSQLTVSRLQEIRRVIKESSGFTRVQAKLINKHIKTAELTAEKVFLQRMQDMTGRFLETQHLHPNLSDESMSVPFYLRFLHIPNAEERASTLISYSLKAEVIALQP